jgi:hypothetical protein
MSPSLLEPQLMMKKKRKNNLLLNKLVEGHGVLEE